MSDDQPKRFPGSDWDDDLPCCDHWPACTADPDPCRACIDKSTRLGWARERTPQELARIEAAGGAEGFEVEVRQLMASAGLDPDLGVDDLRYQEAYLDVLALGYVYVAQNVAEELYHEWLACQEA